MENLSRCLKIKNKKKTYMKRRSFITQSKIELLYICHVHLSPKFMVLFRHLLKIKSVSHKHLSSRGSTSSPIGVQEMGGATSDQWGAVYISSCQHTSIFNSLGHFYIPIPHLYLREGGNSWLNPNTNMYYVATEVCLERKTDFK